MPVFSAIPRFSCFLLHAFKENTTMFWKQGAPVSHRQDPYDEQLQPSLSSPGLPLRVSGQDQLSWGPGRRQAS